MSLELKPFHKFFPIVVLGLLYLSGIMRVINDFGNTPRLFNQLIFLWMAVLIYITFGFLRMVIKIDILSDNQIIFKTYLRREYKIDARDLISIKVKLGVIDFKTRNRKFTTMGTFDGFSDFIAHLKNLNPDLITKGC